MRGYRLLLRLLPFSCFHSLPPCLSPSLSPSSLSRSLPFSQLPRRLSITLARAGADLDANDMPLRWLWNGHRRAIHDHQTAPLTCVFLFSFELAVVLPFDFYFFKKDRDKRRAIYRRVDGPPEMAHAIGGHPIHWHVDPTIKQEIAHYNARRRKNLAGWGARDSLSGDGYKVCTVGLAVGPVGLAVCVSSCRVCLRTTCPSALLCVGVALVAASMGSVSLAISSKY